MYARRASDLRLDSGFGLHARGLACGGVGRIPATRWWDDRQYSLGLLPADRIPAEHYPQALAAMRNRPEMYNRQLAYLEQEEQKGDTLVIRPQEKLPIGHISHDPEEMKRVYDIGREMGEQRIQEIRDFLIDN